MRNIGQRNMPEGNLIERRRFVGFDEGADIVGL